MPNNKPKKSIKGLFILTALTMSAVLMLYCTPTVKALTNAETQALIQQLLTQIAQIQAQIQQLQNQQNQPAAWCHDFTANLGFADSGLQEVAQLHTALDKEGISYGQDTSTTYAEDTAEAVVKFQAKYNIKQTGYVGPLTRAKLNELYGCQNNPNPTCTPSWTCDQWDTLCVADVQSRRCFDSNNCGTTDNMPSLVRTCSTTCTPNWSCTQYSSCVNNNQTRTCTDTNNCNLTSDKPTESQWCNTCTPNWQTGAWSACSGNQQTRTVTDANNCGTTIGKPLETQSCNSSTTCSGRTPTDIYAKGTVTWNNNTYTDYCYYTANNIKVEYFCTDNGYASSTTVTCPQGTCNDGACSGGTTPPCTPNWQTGSWSACANGTQTRTVTDANNCGVTTGKPTTTQSCTVVCTPNWQTGQWSACANGTQTRTVTDSNNCGTTISKPPTTQSCINICTPDWRCGAYGICINGNQTRTCADLYSCGVLTDKPVESTSCQCAPDCNGKVCGDDDGCGGKCAIGCAENATGCTDTDNKLGGVGQSLDLAGTTKGWNYWYKGTTTNSTGSSTDNCIDSKHLKEYVCQADQIVSYTTNCPLGCIDGACKQGVSVFLPSLESGWQEGTSGGIYWSVNGNPMGIKPVNIYLVVGVEKDLIGQAVLPDDEKSGSNGAFTEYFYEWTPSRTNSKIINNYAHGNLGCSGSYGDKCFRILVEYQDQTGSGYSDFFGITTIPACTDSDSAFADQYGAKGIASGWVGTVSQDGKQLFSGYLADPEKAGSEYSTRDYYGSVTLSDFCWDSGTLIEHKCVGEKLTDEYYPCPVGSTCSLGKCGGGSYTQPQTICVATASGVNLVSNGRVTNTFTSGCQGSGLVSYHCNGNSVASSTTNCTVCYNGQCYYGEQKYDEKKP